MADRGIDDVWRGINHEGCECPTVMLEWATHDPGPYPFKQHLEACPHRPTPTKPAPVAIKQYTPKVLDRDWGQEIFIAETDKYLGKVLRMKAGTKGGLQYHVEKDETFYLVSGRALVRSDLHGQLIERVMGEGESYHIPPGAPHQVEALTDCVFFEASTPHYDDRVRVEDRYGLVAEGGLPTTR